MTDWQIINHVGERAAEQFEKLREKIDTEENFGLYVAVDSETGKHRIGKTEQEAEDLFISEFGRSRQVVLFHIGYF